MTVGFTISRFVVIQSLEPHEVLTGSILLELLVNLVNEHAPTLQVDFYNCSNAREFQELLGSLSRDADLRGDRPLLHIECHGSPTEGLEFENGSTLGWNECGELFTQLNIATQFNLLVVVAACYGAYLNGQYSPLKASPAYCIVAPTNEIDPADAIKGFRMFYTVFLRTGDAGIASDALVRVSINAGQWFSQLAENWFVALIDNYIKTHLTHEAFKAWAKSFSRKQRDRGQAASVGATRRRLLHLNREGLTGKYFDQFFCTSEVPQCVSRFRTTRERVQKQVDALRATGKYSI